MVQLRLPTNCQGPKNCTSGYAQHLHDGTLNFVTSVSKQIRTQTRVLF